MITLVIQFFSLTNFFQFINTISIDKFYQSKQQRHHNQKSQKDNIFMPFWRLFSPYHNVLPKSGRAHLDFFPFDMAILLFTFPFVFIYATKFWIILQMLASGMVIYTDLVTKKPDEVKVSAHHSVLISVFTGLDVPDIINITKIEEFVANIPGFVKQPYLKLPVPTQGSNNGLIAIWNFLSTQNN